MISVVDHAGEDIELEFALNGDGQPPTGALSIRNIQFFIPPNPEVQLTLSGTELLVEWPLSAQGWTLESSGDPGPQNWQPETDPPEDGDYFHTMTFDITDDVPRAFFRLRK